jgi:signal transduction histidine kinase
VRRRLALVGLATTALVVITFLVPLGLLVRRQAEDRARVDAERKAQTTASLIALAVTLDGSLETIESATGPLADGVIVVLSDGTILGEPLGGQGTLVESALTDQATVTALVDGGWEIALPVIGRDNSAVVDAMATDAELRSGVMVSWLFLGLLGVVVIAIAVWVADRLGRRLVDPIRELENAAHLLGSGDLDVRVDVDDPPELKEVADAFNVLASRLEQLLIEEREAVADLSHRLRTPLTSLRLQSEGLGDPTERADVLAQVDRLEQSIDQLIVASRSRGKASQARCPLDEVVAKRAMFWKVLADEEGRAIELNLDAPGVELALPAEEVEAVVDALTGNVFSHTAAGTPIWISTGELDNRPWIEIADQGEGFADVALVERGVSGGGSTGLGLDIARRSAEMTGGSLQVDDRPGGGAVVRVWFG